MQRQQCFMKYRWWSYHNALSMKWTWLMWCQWDVQTQGKNLWYCNECMAFNQPLCMLRTSFASPPFLFLSWTFASDAILSAFDIAISLLPKKILMIPFHYPIRKVTAGQFFPCPSHCMIFFLYSECILMKKVLISVHLTEIEKQFILIVTTMLEQRGVEWRNTHSFSPRQHRSLTPSHTHAHTSWLWCDDDFGWGASNFF